MFIMLKSTQQVGHFSTHMVGQFSMRIDKKVISVVKNTKSTNLAGNIKRMQDGEL